MKSVARRMPARLALALLLPAALACNLDPKTTDNVTLAYCNATRFSILVLQCVCTECEAPYVAAGGLAERHCYTIPHCKVMDYCSDCGCPWNWLCDVCEPGWKPSAPDEGVCVPNKTAAPHDCMAPGSPCCADDDDCAAACRDGSGKCSCGLFGKCFGCGDCCEGKFDAANFSCTGT